MIQRFEHKPVEPIDAVQIPLKTDPDYAERHGEIVQWLIKGQCPSWGIEPHGDARGLSYRIGAFPPARPGDWIAKRANGARFFTMSSTQMHSYAPEVRT